MQWLKQSTAYTLKIGPFVDSTDGNTAETALTIAQADVRLSKNGGDIAQKNEATSCTHDELGIYGCPINTTDTGTLGRLQLWVHEAGALPVWHEFMVVPANVWDSFFGADALQVHANEITAGLITATAIATDAIGSDELAATAAQEIADQVWDEAASGHVAAGSFGAQAGTDIDAILADTNELQTDDTPAAIAALNDLSAAQVNAEVDAALNTAIPGAPTADSINQRIVAIDDLTQASGAGDLAAILADTNELQADDTPGAIAALNDPTAAVVADAVWDEASTGHIDAGKAGQQLWTDLDAVLADTNELQTDDIPGAISGLNDPTAAVIADAVWDEDIVAAHNTADTAGLLLDTNLATILADTNELQTDDVPGLIAALNDPTAASVADAVWDELSTGHTDAGKAGLQLWTDLDAVLADTNELQTDWADGGRLDLLLDGASAPSAATVADAVWDEASAGHTDAGKAGQQLWTDLDAVLADTAELQTDDVPSLISALNDIAVTDITQRQIPDSVPADGTLPTIEQALYMITQFLHERAVSGTTVTVKKVDGSTSLLTLTLDDDTDPTSITRAS